MPALLPARITSTALGLLAPLALEARGAAAAAELTSATPGDPVSTVSQFGDVRPTDWAYQALSTLIAR